MYSTRRLSQLLKSPESVATKPDGPNSGYLVIQDEASVTYSCFGCCKNRALKELPFPQDKELTVGFGSGKHSSHIPVFLIPVLNQPLSFNRYYAIVPHGKRKGQAFTCSMEDDKVTCCFSLEIEDVKPRPLDPCNIYQQFEIVPFVEECAARGAFFAKSIAEDGFPPYFLRCKGWGIYTETPDNFKLDEAQGLDHKLRSHLPQEITTSLVVGKWYSPFIFINEGTTLKDQVKRSMYYELTLEQRWEKVFTCNSYGENSVKIDVVVEKEEVFVRGRKAVWNEKSVDNGVVWFTSYGPTGEKTSKRGGFDGGEEKQVKINRVEEFKETKEWSEFGYYVLVERFNVKRMDGSLVLSYDFKHLHHMRAKWE
ncbi:hypothetical protein MIMGU_mgv1a025786mg [Erythranthe guttata]|uniref:Insecticidal crystal toxin domain-containing protein n=1 Tax=Erythranthe guttata TaxID=4155 RepID=A0A022Q3Q7_ERYGU|nr:hypothetical protein MIMGU_mgv1a025786mg [Erythranthe guttata]